jgi:hypothetical protein
MPITQILLTATVSNSPPPPATAVVSLIASEYSGSGTSWPDSNGFRSPGTLVNSPAYQGATIPKYFTFDRQSQQFVQGVSVGDLSTWTIESWFRVLEPLSNTDVTAIITTTYSEYNGNQYGVINYILGNYVEGMQSGSNANLTVGFFAGGEWRTTAGFTPNLNTWYHVVGTYDGTTIKQWVNGTLNTTRTITATPTAGGGAVRIARRHDNAPTAGNYFTGNIAVAKIYDGVLTDEEIVAAYDSTSATYST